MTQTERIIYYEALFDRIRDAQERLRSAREEYEDLQPQLAELAAYYESGDWKRDFGDDEAGLLPADLKRGVLSEDGIWNVLEEDRELVESGWTGDPGQ